MLTTTLTLTVISVLTFSKRKSVADDLPEQCVWLPDLVEPKMSTTSDGVWQFPGPRLVEMPDVCMRVNCAVCWLKGLKMEYCRCKYIAVPPI